MMLREPWRTRLLFLSFAINLVAIPILVVPFVTARYAVHRPLLPLGPPPPGVMIERMAAELPKVDGRRLQDAMEPHAETIEVARVHMEASRREMARQLASTPFDRDATKVAMQKWQANWAAWSRALGDAMLDGAEQLSPEGRTLLAARRTQRRGP